MKTYHAKYYDNETDTAPARTFRFTAANDADAFRIANEALRPHEKRIEVLPA
jgi:hypothetical protein